MNGPSGASGAWAPGGLGRSAYSYLSRHPILLLFLGVQISQHVVACCLGLIVGIHSRTSWSYCMIVPRDQNSWPARGMGA
jgi:hypothetical protein